MLVCGVYLASLDDARGGGLQVGGGVFPLFRAALLLGGGGAE